MSLYALFTFGKYNKRTEYLNKAFEKGWKIKIVVFSDRA
jgi:hypothetical protein